MCRCSVSRRLLGFGAASDIGLHQHLLSSSSLFKQAGYVYPKYYCAVVVAVGGRSSGELAAQGATSTTAIMRDRSHEGYD